MARIGRAFPARPRISKAVRGPGTLTTPQMANNTDTPLASEVGVVVNVYHPTTGALIVQKTGQTSDGSGVVVISDALIVPGVSYVYEVVLASNGRRLPTATAT